MKTTKKKKPAAKGPKFHYVPCTPKMHRVVRIAAKKKGIAMWKYVDGILQKAA